MHPDPRPGEILPLGVLRRHRGRDDAGVVAAVRAGRAADPEAAQHVGGIDLGADAGREKVRMSIPVLRVE